MIAIAILLAITIRTPNPNYAVVVCECKKPECMKCNWPGYKGAALNSLKKQTSSLFSGVLFPLMFSNLF